MVLLPAFSKPGQIASKPGKYFSFISEALKLAASSPIEAPPKMVKVPAGPG